MFLSLKHRLIFFLYSIQLFYFVNMDSMEKSGAANITATKVYYHLDDSSMPYMSEVPVAPDRITLADFKAVLTRKGRRYFCRTWDTQLNSEVKAEIVRDNDRLQRSATELFELFLLSPALPSVSSASAPDGVGNADTSMEKSGAANITATKISVSSASAAAPDGVGNADTLPRIRREHSAITTASDPYSWMAEACADVEHGERHSEIIVDTVGCRTRSQLANYWKQQTQQQQNRQMPPHPLTLSGCMQSVGTQVVPHVQSIGTPQQQAEPLIKVLLKANKCDYLNRKFSNIMRSKNRVALASLCTQLSDHGLDDIGTAFVICVNNGMLCYKCEDNLKDIDELCYCRNSEEQCHHRNCCSNNSQRRLAFD